MTHESDTTRCQLVLAKIGKLIEQCSILLTEDFPYSDSRSALHALRTQAEKLRSQSADFLNWSQRMQQQFLVQVNYKLDTFSRILGIIARSNSMRNSFEIYEPFRRLCYSLLGDRVHLIFSSEWNYTPFTYPMNLQELPSYILIGLPALESNSVLIFPTAGHELGHSIWLNRGMTELYSGHVFSEIVQAAQKDIAIVDAMFTPSGNKEQDDLFSQQIHEQFNLAATTSCLAQLEELFCDFLGLHIFGESYLHAFRYLIAPGGGHRSTKYPQTSERARLLELYGRKLGIKVSGYAEEFLDSRDNSQPYDRIVLRTADAVRDRFVEEMFTAAAKAIANAGIPIPDSKSIVQALTYFEHGMPTDKVNSIGSLIAAAWRFYLDPQHAKRAKGNQSAIGYVSDLVLKSVEASDFREDLGRAQR